MKFNARQMCVADDSDLNWNIWNFNARHNPAGKGENTSHVSIGANWLWKEYRLFIISLTTTAR